MYDFMLKIGNSWWKRGFLRKYKLSKLTHEADSEWFNKCTEIDNVDNDFTGGHYQTLRDRIFMPFKMLQGTEKVKIKECFLFQFIKSTITLTWKLQK